MQKWPPPVSSEVVDRQLRLLDRHAPVAVAAGRLPERPTMKAATPPVTKKPTK